MEDLKNTFLVAQAEPTLQAKQRENAAIYSICAAAVYYFGVYPISMLQSKIQQATGKAMTEQDLILWHNTSIMPRDEFFFKNGLSSTSRYKITMILEKYNMLDGSVNTNQELNAISDLPEMMGWTAGSYLFAKHFINEL